MSAEVEVYRAASLDSRRAYVATLAEAGELIPAGLCSGGRPNVGKMLYVIEAGLMLGLAPAASLCGIDVINDVPTLKPALMSAIIRDAGHKLRMRKTGTIEAGTLAVTWTGIRSDDPDFEFESTWTPHDAVRAGLLDEYAPDAAGVWHALKLTDGEDIAYWQAYTARLCQWRALGDVATAGFEDVLMGLHLTPEEVGAKVNDIGELLPVPAAPVVDWAAQIEAATTSDDVREIKARANAAEQLTDKVRTAALTKLGMLSRAEKRAASEAALFDVAAEQLSGASVAACPECGQSEAHWEPPTLGQPGRFTCQVDPRFVS